MTNDFEKMKETVGKLNNLLQNPTFEVSTFHMFVRERLEELHNQIHKYFGLRNLR